MKLRFAPTADLADTGADQSFTLDVVAPLNTTDFHTSKDEGHLHHAELPNLAAMARSIFHQVGATEVANPSQILRHYWLRLMKTERIRQSMMQLIMRRR
jgi:hypothetical protein